MTTADPFHQQLAEFPAPLRALVEAEIQAGNSIAALEPKPGGLTALSQRETGTSAKRLLHFNDHRPPHEIRFVLERHLMTLFTASMKNDRYEARRASHHSEQGRRHELRWSGDRFVRADVGDYPGTVVWASEAEFLDMLRKYNDWETSQNVCPERVSELVAWKLILRLLRQ